MTAMQRTYGTTTIEAFPFAEADYQTLLIKKTKLYNDRSEGLHYKGMAAHIDFVREMPLELALIEMQGHIRQGYSIVKANSQALFFKCILRKPEEIISSELVKLAESTRDEYERHRFELNVAETARLVEERIFNTRRAAEAEVAAKKARTVAKQQETEGQKALVELLAIYAPNVQVTA